MKTKALLYSAGVVGVCAVVVAAYLLGRVQGAADQAETAPDPGAASATQRSKTASSAAPQSPPIVGHPPGAGERSGAWSFRHFRVGQRNVKALLIDDSVTWFGTSGGLFEFHRDTGKKTFYDNRTGLLSDGVFHVGKIGGEIWVGTYGGGLSVLNPQTRKWRNYNIPQGLADAFVYDVLKTRSGEIWIATWSGANRIVDGKIDNIRNWQLYTVENTDRGLPNDWVYGLAEGKNGEIWLATEGGLARFMDGRWTNWNHKDGLGAAQEIVEKDIQFQRDPGDFSAHHARQKEEQGLGKVKVAYNPNYVVSLMVDPQGVVWAGTWGGGLSRFDGESWKTFTMRDGLPGNHVYALKNGENGALWVGTSRGLAKFDGTRFVRFGKKEGLFSPAVFSVAVGKEGEVWVGSFGGAAWFPRGPQSRAAAK